MSRFHRQFVSTWKKTIMTPSTDCVVLHFGKILVRLFHTHRSLTIGAHKGVLHSTTELIGECHDGGYSSQQVIAVRSSMPGVIFYLPSSRSLGHRCVSCLRLQGDFFRNHHVFNRRLPPLLHHSLRYRIIEYSWSFGYSLEFCVELLRQKAHTIIRQNNLFFIRLPRIFSVQITGNNRERSLKHQPWHPHWIMPPDLVFRVAVVSMTLSVPPG